MLILKSLSLQPMHGFGVTQRIEQISHGVFKVNPGSLLLAFQRLERAGLVEGEWRASENNRRARYYRLTRTGRRRLTLDTDDWKRRVDAITRLLEAVCGHAALARARLGTAPAVLQGRRRPRSGRRARSLPRARDRGGDSTGTDHPRGRASRPRAHAQSRTRPTRSRAPR